jgi:hypothetical protein
MQNAAEPNGRAPRHRQQAVPPRPGAQAAPGRTLGAPSRAAARSAWHARLLAAARTHADTSALCIPPSRPGRRVLDARRHERHLARGRRAGGARGRGGGELLLGAAGRRALWPHTVRTPKPPLPHAGFRLALALAPLSRATHTRAGAAATVCCPSSSPPTRRNTASPALSLPQKRSLRLSQSPAKKTTRAF